MDGSRPGEAGVLAWCNTIRFNMAKDPGRQILNDQIQTQGFDFLDSYLESFFEGPKNEPVIELLKTPGRKRNAPTRTRSATAAAAEKARVITSLSFEDGDMKENRGPVNEFQKALLRVKEKADEEAGPSVPSQQPAADRPLKSHPSFAKLKSQKIVTIADSPLVQPPGRDAMDLDENPKPLPAVSFEPEPRQMETDSQRAREPSLHASQDASKELSMIAEDDEPVERSRVSVGGPPVTDIHLKQKEPISASTSDGHDTFHDAPQEPLDIEPMDMDQAENVRAAPAPEPEEPIVGDMTPASVNTFHSIPLDSPSQPEREPQSSRTEDHHTAPLPRVSLSPIPVEEELHAHTAPLPSSSGREEYTVPLRDESSVPVPGLSGKASVPQFAGLPAPSPFRKSLRVPADPTTASGGGGGTAAPPGGKRTSWLSKARETKALESTAKRTSTLGHGLGLTTFTSNKRKSGEMLGSAQDVFTAPIAVLRSVEEEQRVAKVPKIGSSPADIIFDSKGKSKSLTPEPVDEFASRATFAHETAAATAATTDHATTEVQQRDDTDALSLLKKTTAGYGARVGKSMGKSLGGNAAAALAEARAKAEARVAERHKLEMGLTTDSEDVSMSEEKADEKPISTHVVASTIESQDSQRRLSVSDLVPSSHGKGKGVAISAQPSIVLDADTSTSTTPPNSPPVQNRPASFIAPSGPVFSKPAAPSGPRPLTTASSAAAPPTRSDTTSSIGRDYSFKLPNNPFSIPAAMTLGVGATKLVPLSAQSSKGSIFSDVVFDSNNASPQPAWMTSTQDTSYSAGGSQNQGFGKVDEGAEDDLDEDDSWGVDEKFAAHQTWTPFGFSSADPGTNGDQVLKDDTMTWSTLPSRSTSQRGGDTGLMQSTMDKEDEEHAEAEAEEDFVARLAAAAQQPSDADEGMNEVADIAMEIDEDVEEREDDLEAAILSGKPTVTLVQQTRAESVQPRSDSQQSMASTASSSQQSQLGFFGQASKLVSSVLGGGKKTKPEVKSLQLAAAAAKKQQEELEKKAARLKEMENRRQLALQRKAEEEKTRALEEERKIKEEAERRKREREEHTDKRPLRSTTTVAKKQTDEDNTKKREPIAKPAQKPPSKDKKDTAVPRAVKPPAGPAASTSSKPVTMPKSALKQPSSSAIPATPGGAKATATKVVRAAPSSSNLKSAAAKGKAPVREPSEQPPAKPSRTTAQPGPPADPPRVASESIELPDINSEYSDSDDEDRPKRDLPDWAQSPDIAAALQQQSTINPDDIFGRIGPLRMEEIFRTRQSRFRARTSSANWTGTDELTAEEEREYARRMGFR